MPRAKLTAVGGTDVKRDQALEASYRFCSGVARREAKNFYHAFLLLPPKRRRSMCALYAFMRRTDDLADEPGPALLKAQALAPGGASSTPRWRAKPRRGLGCLPWLIPSHVTGFPSSSFMT